MILRQRGVPETRERTTAKRSPRKEQWRGERRSRMKAAMKCGTLKRIYFHAVTFIAGEDCEGTGWNFLSARPL
jgi:hypothetical protein